MDDRFKFRAAFDDEPNVYEVVSITDSQIGLLIENKVKYYSTDRAGLTLSQCTGLKDSTGKLIYEGDIVKRTKFKNKNTLIGQVIYCAKEARFKLSIPDNDAYSFKDNSKVVNLYDIAYTLEVIGNVFEDRQLLEARD